MTDELRIGKVGRRVLRLPPETLTQAAAIFGVRGVGKTVTAKRLVEQALGAGHQVAVLDPTDVWWGLKSSADGSSPGFNVPILGGEHGDLPLEPGSGRLVADLVVDRRIPVVLSLRHLRKGKQRELVTEFAEQVYHRKGAVEKRTPLLVVIDEASAFVPQRVGAAEARMVGAVEDLVRRGRAAGLGVLLVDQRPASVNKDVLTQIELLVSHRVTSPQDTRALREWIKLHDSEDREKEFLGELSSLAIGEAWVWAPASDLFERVAVEMCETFDSSKTPKLGEDPVRPEALAEIDLDELRSAMADTVAEAEANDPKKLREEIDELLAERSALQGELDVTVEQLEDARRASETKVEDLVDEATDRIEEEVERRVAERFRDIGAELAESAGRGLLSIAESARRVAAEVESKVLGLGESAERYLATLEVESESVPEANVKIRHRRETLSVVRPRTFERPDVTKNGDRAAFPDAQLRILDTLRDIEALGGAALDRRNLAVFSQQSPKSSTYAGHVAELARNGYVRAEDGVVLLEPAGRRIAVDSSGYEERSLDGLHRAWLGYLPDYAADLLRVLLDAYPDGLTREELAARAGRSSTSSTFAGHVSTLTDLGVAEIPRAGRLRAGGVLFPEGVAP